MPYTPDTPGKDIVFDKPGIPVPAWLGEITKEQILEAFVTKNVQGDTVSFSDGANNIPVKSLTVDVFPIQAGSGTPAPDNIREITPIDSLVLSHGNGVDDPKEYTFNFGKYIYGGTLDVLTGVFKINKIGRVFDGTENWGRVPTYGSGNNVRFRLTDSTAKTYASPSAGKAGCSHYEVNIITSNTNYPETVGFGPYTSSGYENTYLMFRPDLSVINTLDEWTNFLATQYTNGTPVSCWWEIISNIQEIQFTPIEMLTLLGDNVFSVDNEDSTIDLTYRCDPTAIYNELKALI